MPTKGNALSQVSKSEVCAPDEAKYCTGVLVLLAQILSPINQPPRPKSGSFGHGPNGRSEWSCIHAGTRERSLNASTCAADEKAQAIMSNVLSHSQRVA